MSVHEFLEMTLERKSCDENIKCVVGHRRPSDNFACPRRRINSTSQ
jgi:hypothetical protein